jgi:hypothetical protein
LLLLLHPAVSVSSVGGILLELPGRKGVCVCVCV